MTLSLKIATRLTAPKRKAQLLACLAGAKRLRRRLHSGVSQVAFGLLKDQKREAILTKRTLAGKQDDHRAVGSSQVRRSWAQRRGQPIVLRRNPLVGAGCFVLMLYAAGTRQLANGAFKS